MSKSLQLSKPSPISKDLSTENFDCGNSQLNQYLKGFAYINHQNGSARTYVTVNQQEEVIGYYSLAAGSIKLDEAPERVAKGLARYPIPLIILARLAVDKNYKKRGIGKGLMLDAFLRVLQAADKIGVRALLVHAQDNEARKYYQDNFGFISSDFDQFHLYLLIKDIRFTIQNL